MSDLGNFHFFLGKFPNPARRCSGAKNRGLNQDINKPSSHAPPPETLGFYNFPKKGKRLKKEEGTQGKKGGKMAGKFPFLEIGI